MSQSAEAAAKVKPFYCASQSTDPSRRHRIRGISADVRACESAGGGNYDDSHGYHHGGAASLFERATRTKENTVSVGGGPVGLIGQAGVGDSG